MVRNNFRDTLCEQLKASRESSGITQKEMAKLLGVGERTIQNWESGYSEPLVSQLKKWFEVLSIQPQPYILKILYDDIFIMDNKYFTDENVDNALIALLSSYTIHTKKELLYLFYGSHGSNPASVLEMITAHLHTPLRHRINVSEQIITNYEIAASMNELIEPGNEQPNIDRLKNATNKAKEAILNKKDSYNTI